MFYPPDHEVDLSEEEFRLLRDFIHEQFGLYYDEGQRSSLRSRLAGRLSLLGLLSFEDYYHYLRFAPQRAEVSRSTSLIARRLMRVSSRIQGTKGSSSSSPRRAV